MSKPHFFIREIASGLFLEAPAVEGWRSLTRNPAKAHDFGRYWGAQEHIAEWLPSAKYKVQKWYRSGNRWTRPTEDGKSDEVVFDIPTSDQVRQTIHEAARMATKALTIKAPEHVPGQVDYYIVKAASGRYYKGPPKGVWAHTWTFERSEAHQFVRHKEIQNTFGPPEPPYRTVERITVAHNIIGVAEKGWALHNGHGHYLSGMVRGKSVYTRDVNNALHFSTDLKATEFMQARPILKRLQVGWFSGVTTYMGVDPAKPGAESSVFYFSPARCHFSETEWKALNTPILDWDRLPWPPAYSALKIDSPHDSWDVAAFEKHQATRRPKPPTHFGCGIPRGYPGEYSLTFDWILDERRLARLRK